MPLDGDDGDELLLSVVRTGTSSCFRRPAMLTGTAVDRPGSWRRPENCGGRRDGAVGWRFGEAARLEPLAAGGDEADPTCSPHRWGRGRGRRKQGMAALATGKGNGRGARASRTANGGAGGGEGRRRGTLALASHRKGTRRGERSGARGGVWSRGAGVCSRGGSFSVIRPKSWGHFRIVHFRKLGKQGKAPPALLSLGGARAVHLATLLLANAFQFSHVCFSCCL
jgi:hypothetical protein